MDVVDASEGSFESLLGFLAQKKLQGQRQEASHRFVCWIFLLRVESLPYVCIPYPEFLYRKMLERTGSRASFG